MAQELVSISLNDMERMAMAIAKSGLFGLKTPEAALALMLISHAEGLHPAMAARDFDIIQGRPAKKAEAMQRDFLAAGGKIEWHEMTDERASATFSHPAGGTLRIEWDTPRAVQAELASKPMWKKFPRQMLRARVISEGVRSVYPAATSGMYVPEEVQMFDAPKPERDITPPTEKKARDADGEAQMSDEVAQALLGAMIDADEVSLSLIKDQIKTLKKGHPWRTPLIDAYNIRKAELAEHNSTEEEQA